jgi:hypothetical protein
VAFLQVRLQEDLQYRQRKEISYERPWLNTFSASGAVCAMPTSAELARQSIHRRIKVCTMTPAMAQRYR